MSRQSSFVRIITTSVGAGGTRETSDPPAKRKVKVGQAHRAVRVSRTQERGRWFNEAWKGRVVYYAKAHPSSRKSCLSIHPASPQKHNTNRANPKQGAEQIQSRSNRIQAPTRFADPPFAMPKKQEARSKKWKLSQR